MNKHDVEYTDTFDGEANYNWVRRAVVTMPEIRHYSYDGATNYAKANRTYNRELMKRAKAAVGITGARGRTYHNGDMSEFRPYKCATVLFIDWHDDAND